LCFTADPCCLSFLEKKNILDKNFMKTSHWV
jgi:hypothetical protein